MSLKIGIRKPDILEINNDRWVSILLNLKGLWGTSGGQWNVWVLERSVWRDGCSNMTWWEEGRRLGEGTHRRTEAPLAAASPGAPARGRPRTSTALPPGTVPTGTPRPGGSSAQRGGGSWWLQTAPLHISWGLQEIQAGKAGRSVCLQHTFWMLVKSIQPPRLLW